VSCSSTGAKFDMETDIIRNGSGKAELKYVQARRYIKRLSSWAAAF